MDGAEAAVPLTPTPAAAPSALASAPAFAAAPRAESLIAAFDFPRQTAAQRGAARDSVVALLTRAGCEPRVTPFAAVPGRMDATAGAALLAAFAVARARRRPHVLAALGLALLACAAAAGGLDAVLAHQPAFNIDASIEPRVSAAREVWFGAHYDSKTEGMDHRARAMLWFAAVGLAGAALMVVRRSPRTARVCGVAAFAIAAATASAGRWTRHPGHGIVDNGASVALLLEIAATLQAQPLDSTRVRCIFWDAEEWGAQGSRQFVGGAAAPAAAVNLEAVGAGPGLGVPRWEWTGSRWGVPDAALLAAIRDAAPGAPAIADVALPVVTDCGPLLEARIPAMTLLGLERGGHAPRGLHTAADQRHRLDRDGVAAARDLLWMWLHSVDPAPGPQRQAMPGSGSD